MRQFLYHMMSASIFALIPLLWLAGLILIAFMVVRPSEAFRGWIWYDPLLVIALFGAGMFVVPALLDIPPQPILGVLLTLGATGGIASMTSGTFGKW